MLTTLEEIRVYNDPYRIEILCKFDKLNRPATCKEIADMMQEVPAKVYYHVKKMEKAGILQMVYTKNINGIIAKYYEPTAEEFRLEGSFGDDETKNVILNQAYSKTVESIFYTAKEDFLSSMKRDAKKREKSGKKYKGDICYSNINLTEEEAEKLDNYIQGLLTEKKHAKGKKYSMFFSLIIDKDEIE